jgi:hypothetical protein
MPTHFHFLVQIKDIADIDIMYYEENSLWMQFRGFLGTYTKAINRIYQRSGHLFAVRYSRVNVSDEYHLFELITYIHKNPQNYGIVSNYKIWPYSSYYAYERRDRRSLLARNIFSDDDLYTTILESHDGSNLNQEISLMT